jgi:hypothetical protein
MLGNKFKYKSILLNNKFKFFFYKNSFLFLLGFFGIIVLNLSSFYFFKFKNNYLYLLFLNKFFYLSFIKHFKNNYNYLFNIFSIRLKIKGLGYRIRKITKNLYYFFFNYTNMYYLNLPNNILIK